MGISEHTLKTIIKSTQKYKKSDWKDVNICLFGNLYIRDNAKNYINKLCFDYNHISMKFFQNMSSYVTCFDINGKDGAIPYDLGYEIPYKSLFNKFDILINGGTIEHVNSHKNAQYICFKNVHDLCKLNSIIIHLAPEVGSWPYHCSNHYTNEFFHLLANSTGYEIINENNHKLDGSRRGNLLLYSMKKIIDTDFVNIDSFNKIWDKSGCTNGIKYV